MFLETIVVPVDFGPASHAAWRAACDLARIGGSRLHLVHVCAEPLHQPWAGQADVDLDALALEWASEAAEHIAGFASPPDIDPARVTRTVVRGCAHRDDRRPSCPVMAVRPPGMVSEMVPVEATGCVA